VSKDLRRWDQLTPQERCFRLFKKIDANTRGLAKLASAVVYLDELEAVIHEVAPDLLVALRTVVRERRNLRSALEADLANTRAMPRKDGAHGRA
jgi:hypothetical protein